MATIRSEVDHEVGAHRYFLEPRVLDPRVIISREIVRKAEEAYAEHSRLGDHMRTVVDGDLSSHAAEPVLSSDGDRP
jgi:hypothetical protein